MENTKPLAWPKGSDEVRFYIMDKFDKGSVLKGKNYLFKYDAKTVILSPRTGFLGGIFSDFAKRIEEKPYCRPELNVEDPACKEKYEDTIKNGARTIQRTIETKRYNEIIEESVEDIDNILKQEPLPLKKDKIQRLVDDKTNLKLIAAAIISAESSAVNERVSTTGCMGLMQFCEGAAIDEGLCDKKDGCCEPETYCTYRDWRKTPGKAIPAGIKHFLRKSSFFSEYTDQELFGLAAYNGGEGTIQTAIEIAKKKNPKPSWQDVKDALDSDTVKRYIKEKIPQVDPEEKVKEIQCYPYKVINYKQQLIGLFPD